MASQPPNEGSLNQLRSSDAITNLQDQNSLLRAQLEKLQKEKLIREQQELQRQIEELGAIPTPNLPIFTPIQPSSIEDSVPDSTASQPSLQLANPVWTDFSFDNYNLPPTGIYSSRVEALSAVNTWALPKGYGFSQNSKKYPDGRIRAFFRCDRRYAAVKAGKMKERGEGRNKSSKGCDCPFSLKCNEQKNGTWKLEYREPWTDKSIDATTNYCMHNHRPSSGTGSEHASQRREQRQGVRYEALIKQLNAGSKPRHILTYLDKNHTNDMAIAQDIYNIISQIRSERRGGKSSIETLLIELEKKGWITRPVYEEENPNRLMSIFFSHPRLLEYARLYAKVIIIDHTYNTNSAEMPLFEAIGIDAVGKSFCICFEFTAGQDEEDCVQSLELLKEMLGNQVEPGVILVDKAEAMRKAIDRVFPDWVYLLCIWHANKSVSQHCKGNFGADEWERFMKDWTKIIYSSTKEEYQDSVEHLQSTWSDEHLDDVAYIEANWLIPRNRDRIVFAWTNRHLHLGNTATSRAEGIHGTIKADIKSKNIDLLYAWDTIDDVIMRQLKALDQEQRRQRHATKAHYQYELFSLIRGRVSFKALDLAYHQYTIAKIVPSNELEECSKTFTASIGVPCKHTIKTRLNAGEPLKLTDFGSAYYLRAFQGEDYHTPTLPPIKRPGRQTRHNGSATSTRRLESGFERAARETAQKVAYEAGKPCWKCSVCPPEIGWGHKKSMIICPRHLKHQSWLSSQGNGPDSTQRSSTSRSRTQLVQRSDTEDIIEVAMPNIADNSSNSTRPSALEDPLAAPTIETTVNSPHSQISEGVPLDTEQNASKSTMESSELDPDLELDQYFPHTTTDSNGFTTYNPGKEIIDLPQEKQKKVWELLNAQANANDSPENDDDDDIQSSDEEDEPVADRSLYRTRGKSKWERLEMLKTEHQQRLETVEAVYFIYKWKRNQWQCLQPKGADISDQAYRVDCKLPIYKAAQLKAWKSSLGLISKGMPRFCETRQAPYNIWTMPEKLAWIDAAEAQDKWINAEEEALAKRWNGKTPGHLDYKKALDRSAKGGVLTTREKAILKDNVYSALEMRDKNEQAELDMMHIEVTQAGTDDPFELDWKEDNMAQINAHHDTLEALEEWKYKQEKMAGKGKRIASGPSPSKVSSSGKTLRAAKKSKKTS